VETDRICPRIDSRNRLIAKSEQRTTERRAEVIVGIGPRGTPKTGHRWTPENRPTRWLSQGIDPDWREYVPPANVLDKELLVC
jgi:hypothetical protein